MVTQRNHHNPNRLRCIRHKHNLRKCTHQKYNPHKCTHQRYNPRKRSPRKCICTSSGANSYPQRQWTQTGNRSIFSLLCLLPPLLQLLLPWLPPPPLILLYQWHQNLIGSCSRKKNKKRKGKQVKMELSLVGWLVLFVPSLVFSSFFYFFVLLFSFCFILGVYITKLWWVCVCVCIQLLLFSSLRYHGKEISGPMICYHHCYIEFVGKYNRYDNTRWTFTKVSLKGE